MKAKIRLDTMKDAENFVRIVNSCCCDSDYVYIKDGNGLCVNGKSILGALHAMEFSDLWCDSNVDFYWKIVDYVC